VVKKPSSHNWQNFTAKPAKEAEKVRKGASNTFSTRHILCALCADMVFFVVKINLNALIGFTTKPAMGAAKVHKGAQLIGEVRCRIGLGRGRD
jgi:hypothetical protein